MNEKQLGIAGIEVVGAAAQREAELTEKGPHRHVGSIGGRPKLGGRGQIAGVANEGGGNAAAALQLIDDDQFDEWPVQEACDDQITGDGTVALRNVAVTPLDPEADVAVPVGARRGKLIQRTQERDVRRLGDANLQHQARSAG